MNYSGQNVICKGCDYQAAYNEKIARLILTLLIPFSRILLPSSQNINILLVKMRIPAGKRLYLTQR